MKYLSLLLCLLLAASSSLHAQDSVKTHRARRNLIKAFAAPVVLVGAGLAVIHKNDGDADDFIVSRYQIRSDRNKDFPHFHTSADNYLQYAPDAMTYLLSFSGVKGKHDIANQTAILIKSEILMTAIVFPVKTLTHVQRPDGSNYHSFPSGHTAQAFAAATFLHREYGNVSVWYSIGGYTAATAVGVLRILNNKHWLSDVFAGAGIGILSTNLIYLTHQDRWGKKGNHVTLTPTYNRGAGMYFCYQFK